MAGNAIVFAESVLNAAGRPLNNAEVRGVAVAVATSACLLHAGSRKWGIRVNNAFGILKLAILVLMFILGVAYASGRIGGSDKVASENLNVHTSLKSPSSTTYGYLEAFLAILFSIGGFNQANYVSVLAVTDLLC